MKVGIVITVRDADRGLAGLLRRHARVGFTHFYVFLDGPPDPKAAARLRPLKAALRLHRRGPALERLWRLAPEYRRFRRPLRLMVTARQQMNVRVALARAIADGVDWLFHLDDDELLVPRGGDVAAVLAAVPRRVEQLVVLNHEALLRRLDCDAPFDEIAEFKINPRFCARAQLDAFDRLGKTPYYFLSYAKGKAAVRVASLRGRPVTAPGVHRILGRGRRTALADPRELALLHFPFPGFGGLIRKFAGANRSRLYQYEFDRKRTNFYTEARRLVRGGDVAALQDFFQRHAVYSGRERAWLRRHGLVWRRWG